MGARIFDLNLEEADVSVLKIIYHATRLELERRRNQKMISDKELSDLVSKMKHDPGSGSWRRKKFHPKIYQSHIKPLIDLDWSHLFSGSSERKFYVYAHIKPCGLSINFNKDQHGIDLRCGGVPFYIGKGCGDRAFDLKRNEGHGKVLAQLKRNGVKPEQIVRIVEECLTEAEALELESKLIYFFGTKFESGRYGCLVNLEIPNRPEGFI